MAAMTLTFVRLQSNFPELRKWGASAGKMTFVILKDDDDDFFAASALVIGVDGGYDLGEFESFEGARIACEHHLDAEIRKHQDHRKPG